MDLLADAYEYLRPGGLVMIPIILTSLWMWALIIERLFFFRRMSKEDVNLKQAVEMLSKERLPGAFRGIRTSIVRNFLTNRSGDKKLDQSLLEQFAMKERPYIRRSLSVIAVLAAVAPLFGLLGTVTGMITTFDVISLFGTGNAKAMAGGISEALITTQSGLMVAIPGLFMSAFLYRRASRLEGRLDELVMTLKRYV